MHTTVPGNAEQDVSIGGLTIVIDWLLQIYAGETRKCMLKLKNNENTLLQQEPHWCNLVFFVAGVMPPNSLSSVRESSKSFSC
jgi:hypothetical protein